jgi:hypothetical protein
MQATTYFLNAGVWSGQYIMERICILVNKSLYERKYLMLQFFLYTVNTSGAKLRLAEPYELLKLQAVHAVQTTGTQLMSSILIM